MAREYAKVLNALAVDYDVVGRGPDSCAAFEKATGKKPAAGGLDDFLNKQSHSLYSHAIVATGIDTLNHIALKLINAGVKNSLLEKPGGMNTAEMDSLENAARINQASVYIAYNRRFYASVLKAREIIKADGGLTSFNFEFTEWSHVIEPLKTDALIKQKWFLANSTHVADLAFYFGGLPLEMSAYRAGNLSWHKYSKFTGAGVCENHVLFSYQANWGSPGRWALELLTSEHRLILKPLEGLQIQATGTVAVNPVELDDVLDKGFKPGLYKQTFAFLGNETSQLCSIDYQTKAMRWYDKISGYDPV